MAITVEKAIDFAAIKDDLQRSMVKAFSDQIQLEATEIIRRTQSGVDADGQAFDEYTPEYRRFKVDKRGRSGTVDLTFSGAMLDDIQTSIEVIPEGYLGKIFFASVEQAAKALGNMAKRKFFALSDEQIGRIETAVNQAIGK